MCDNRVMYLLRGIFFRQQLFLGGYCTAVREVKSPIHRRIPIAGVQNIILVSSTKGGVGKSTVAVNLALSIKKMLPYDAVGIMDADVFGPSIPKMMNLENLQPEVDEKKRIIPLLSYGIKCMSIGFLVSSTSAVVWRGLMVMSAIQQLLRQVVWGPLHTLVVDMPPGTGDVQLSIYQNVPIQGVVIVTTPQAVAVSDVHRGINMLEKLKVPILGIVENMSGFMCPSCGHTSSLFTTKKGSLGGADRLAELTGLPVLDRIPFDVHLAECADDGRPLVVAYPESPVAQVYHRLAGQILQVVPNGGPSMADDENTQEKTL